MSDEETPSPLDGLELVKRIGRGKLRGGVAGAGGDGRLARGEGGAARAV